VDLSLLPGQGCAAKSDPRFAHVGTVDAARDLDLARALVKDEALTYLGKSYGTLLGATYAELFPDRVGRMVLDGVLPASLDLVEVTKGQADAFEVAVDDFARDCLTYSDCPLSGTTDEAVVQLQDWLASLDANPIPGSDRDLNEPLAAYAVLANLYFPSYDYPRLRSALAAAIERNDPTEMFDILDARINRGPDGRYLDNSTEAFYAITCLDRPYEGTVDDVRALAEEWKSSAPTFGPALAWGLLVCKDWPASTETVTQTVAAGSNPILVVSTRKDPATPYQWGTLLADELDNATLVTYEGVGHTAYKEGSACVDEAVDRYLLKGTVPEKDLVCS
jgi:pimeloyl-ACP methyl ester carboxylesterase